MKVALATLVAGFVDIEVLVPEATGTFDPTLVDVIRIEVEADPAYGYDFQSPATVIYIDSVVSSNGAVTHPFDTLPANLDFGSVLGGGCVAPGFTCEAIQQRGLRAAILHGRLGSQACALRVSGSHRRNFMRDAVHAG